MAESEGLEPALRAHRGSAPCVPLCQPGKPLFPRAPSGDRIFILLFASQKYGGEGGIRTPVTIARKSGFESDAFDHSATSPGRKTFVLKRTVIVGEPNHLPQV